MGRTHERHRWDREKGKRNRQRQVLKERDWEEQNVLCNKLNLIDTRYSLVRQVQAKCKTTLRILGLYRTIKVVWPVNPCQKCTQQMLAIKTV